MPDQITITITPEDQQRLGYKARTVGRSPRKFLEDLIHELAQTYPLPPARPAPRPLAEVRAASRLRNGGVSAYTAAIPVIPPKES